MSYIGNPLQDSFTTIDKQVITGDGGSSYTLDYPVANEQEIEVFVNNVRQKPGVAYTVSGQSLTMTGNVTSTDDFYVVYQGKALQTVNPANNTITTAMLKDNAVTSDKIVDGTIAAGDLADTLDLSGKTVTLPAGTGGKVLQVLSATKTDTQSFASSATFSDISGLSITITPTNASSKFLIMWSVSAGNGTDGSHFYVRLQRNGTNLALGDAASNRSGASGMVINTGHAGQRLTNASTYLDSPATTSAITYKLVGTSNWTGGGTSWVNRSTRDQNLAGYDGRDSSSITVMEIAG